MTNAEFYRDEILENHDDFCEEFVIPKVLVAVKRRCASDHSKKHNDYEIVRCNQCCFIQSAWLLEEHEEPEIDWESVPIDTPILVRNNENDEWLKRHFSGVGSLGTPFAWINGQTSFTVNGSPICAHWKHMKLWEGSEEQKEEQQKQEETDEESEFLFRHGIRGQLRP